MTMFMETERDPGGEGTERGNILSFTRNPRANEGALGLAGLSRMEGASDATPAQTAGQTGTGGPDHRRRRLHHGMFRVTTRRQRPGRR
jgi:hypothetical protein